MAAEHAAEKELVQMKRDFANCFDMVNGHLIPRGPQAEVHAIQLLARIAILVLNHEITREHRHEVQLFLNLVVEHMRAGD